MKTFPQINCLFSLSRLNIGQAIYTISRLASHALMFAACFIACLSMSSVASAITVNLGNLDFVATTATFTQTGFSELQTIDGTIGTTGSLNGWAIGGSGGGGAAFNQSITWIWNPHNRPTLAQDEKVNFFTYTIDLYMGYDKDHSLRQYHVNVRDVDSTTYSTITNYESVSNTEDNTISVDENGVINAEQPKADAGLDIHTLVFKSSKRAHSIILTTHANKGGWGTSNNFVLSEIEGSVTAEVVPEPSTYALLLGCITFFGGLALKKRYPSNTSKTSKS